MTPQNHLSVHGGVANLASFDLSIAPHVTPLVAPVGSQGLFEPWNCFAAVNYINFGLQQLITSEKHRSSKVPVYIKRTFPPSPLSRTIALPHSILFLQKQHFDNNMFGFGESKDAYDQVEAGNHASLTHEAISGAAAFEVLMNFIFPALKNFTCLTHYIRFRP